MGQVLVMLKGGIKLLCGEGRLTTDHAASLNGVPILLLAGQAYAPGQVEWLDGSREMLRAAGKAGYAVRVGRTRENSQWP